MRGHIRAGEVPELIKKTAQEFAGEFYDGERSPRFRLNGAKYGLSEKAYVNRYWTNFVDIAVQVLSALLAQPGTPEEQKEKIYEALVDFKTTNSTVRPKPAMSLRSLN